MRGFRKLTAALLLAALAVSGCSSKEKEETAEATPTPEIQAEETATPTPTSTPEPTEEPEPLVPDVPEGMVMSYLTGEYVPEEIGRRRPAAIMINNIEASLPQWGISHAGIIYEAPVEGGITRMMAIFEDYDSLERIGSVRSCRDYFINYAMGYEAIYVHYGQSVYAEPYLAMDEVNNLSGLSGYGDQIFYRTTDRKPPHNAYISGAGIQEGIGICGYSQEYSEGYQGNFRFASSDAPVLLENGSTALRVEPGGYNYNNAYFLYDPDTGLYYRYQFDGPQIDEEDGSQLAVKNIIIQYSSWENYDSNGYLNIHPDQPGTGKYITNGRAIDITWSRDSAWEADHYYDSEGNEITLNPGKTWILIVLDSYADQTVIE